MYLRDLERIIRELRKQRVDAEYIRHYLMETYQVAPQEIEAAFRNVGLTGDHDDGNPMGQVAKRRDRANKFY